MNPQETLKLAKQGNTEAISVFLNQALKAKGITGKVGRTNDSLQIFLESAELVEQEPTVKLIRQGLINLKPESIGRARVQFRQIGSDFTDWIEQFNIEDAKEDTNLSSPSVDLQANKNYEPRKLSSFRENLNLFLMFFVVLPVFGLIGYFMITTSHKETRSECINNVTQNHMEEPNHALTPNEMAGLSIEYDDCSKK